MTTIELQSRVIAQLAIIPPGQARTAAEIAHGMAVLSARDIEPTLRLFWQQGLAVRIEVPRQPDKWRLA